MDRRVLTITMLVFVAALAGVAGPVFNVGFSSGTEPSWAAATGTWQIAGGQLRGENGRVLFPVQVGAGRRVEATIASLAGEWAAVVAKYQDENNWVEVRIMNSGVLLVTRTGGLERTWNQAIASTFPATLTLAFSGSKARVLVNGNPVLEAANPAWETMLGAAGVAVRGQAAFSQFHASSFAGPVLITSLGRSPGGLMAKVLAERAGLAHDYIEGAQPSDLRGVQTLILVLGASSKGLGAAGISLDDEITRGRALVAEARRQGLAVVVMHIEGEPRRGALSDALITEFTPQADYVVVKTDGNADGLFTTLCQAHGLPLRTITTTAEAAEVMVDLFSLWR